MKLHGLQKMTLLDFPQHVACTVFLGGCDFRCPFCHNFELVDGTAPPVMDAEEFFAFLDTRHGLLDGVAVTGGEPTLHRELPDFLARCRDMGFATKVDTAGYHPDMLETLLSRGLVDYVAMDVKNSPEKYAETCGVSFIDMQPIYKSIDLLKAGDIDYEFRTTCIAQFHEAQDIEAIGQMIEGAQRYFLQAFTDRDTVPYEGFSAPNAEEMHRFAEIAKKYVPSTEVRGIE